MSCPICKRYTNIPEREAVGRAVSGFLTADQAADVEAQILDLLGREAKASSVCRYCLVDLMAAAV